MNAGEMQYWLLTGLGVIAARGLHRLRLQQSWTASCIKRCATKHPNLAIDESKLAIATDVRVLMGFTSSSLCRIGADHIVMRLHVRDCCVTGKESHRDPCYEACHRAAVTRGMHVALEPLFLVISK